MAERKIFDDSWSLSVKNGNGLLRREVWENDDGNIVRYNLAYINHSIFKGDNGRVVGYDNAHAYHHKHYMGTVEAIEFISFEHIEECFQSDWIKFRSKK